MTMQQFDLVVIGTGSAASAVAFPCRSAGWRVAVIDSRPFGGTCALRGCDPKKVLVAAAEVIDWIDRLRGKGVRTAERGIDWDELMRFKRTFTDPVPQRREESFGQVGMATFHGRARFVAPTVVEVGDERLASRYVVVAAGARPKPLPIPGGEFLTTSDEFLDRNALPPRLVFVGGGYISLEFAHVAARTGAQVTVLHRGPRLLEAFDSDLVEQLAQRTRDLGVRVHVRTEATGIERTSRGVRVHVSEDGHAGLFEADMVVHGAGRVPDIEDLQLNAAGIRFGKQGIEVNDYLQSVSNPAVYAAGDAAAGGPPLTPVAGYEGEVVAANLLKGNHRLKDYRAVPSVVFTIPPLAAVGVTEQRARQEGHRFRVRHEQTTGWYSSRRVGENVSGFKMLIDEDSDQILGAHLLGIQAEEVINLVALAIRFGIRATDLKQFMFAYPTHGSDLGYML